MHGQQNIKILYGLVWFIPWERLYART